MNKLSYLSSLRTTNPREIYDTWTALGELRATNKTKTYIKDTIFMVSEEGQMQNAIVYCNYDYSVNVNEGFPPIDWSTATPDSTNGMIYFYQGVVSPNFTVVLTKEEYELIDKTVETPDEFIPFSSNNSKASSISITDEEYSIIVSELGIPFLREEELEYNRDTIIDICIKPAIDQYYAFFPLVIDEACGSFGANAQFKVAYHDFKDNPTAVAYKGVPFATAGLGGASATFGSGAFNYVRTEMMSMGSYGGGYGFGGGIRYRKCVPGYTGN